MSKVVELKHVKKTFKTSFSKSPSEVLKDISFHITAGSITGFLGANGAGKTTTFKCMLGLLFPDAGQIEFFGKETLDNAIKSKIGFMPERPQFPEYLTAEEFLLYYLSLYNNLEKKKARALIDNALKQVRLLESKKQLLKNFSKGMIQRIGIAQAIIHEPELVILDEPMSGLDPDGRVDLSNLILEIHKTGKTIFFSSHLLDDVQKLCDELVILKKGSTLFQGSKIDFMNQFKAKYAITYTDGGKMFTDEMDSLNSLNKKIDQLRTSSCQIVEVRTKNTLEEAYVVFQKGTM